MQKTFFILAALCALCGSLAAQTKAVTKTISTGALNEGFTTGGNTLTISATGTLSWAAGATLSGASDFRTSAGLAIGTNVQAYDADLTTYAGITPSANVQTLLGAANFAAFRTSLDVPNLTSTNTYAGRQIVTDTTDGFGLGDVGAIKTSGGIYAVKSIVAGAHVTAAGYVLGKMQRPGFLYGFTLSNNASDATNDIDIAPGVATSVYSPFDAVGDGLGIAQIDTYGNGTSSAITKRLDATWTVGTGNGGLDQGTIANATYHVHAITDDAGHDDVIFSLSHDGSATVTMTIASPCVVTWGTTNKGHGLVAGSPIKFNTDDALPTGVTAGTQYYVIATGLTETTFQFSATNGGSAVNSSGSQSGTHTGHAGPKLPTGYTHFRRIGSIVRAGGAILPFRQDGDEFTLTTPVLDVDDTTLTTSRKTYTLASAPTGLPLRVRVRALMTNASAGILAWIGPLSETDAAPSQTASPLTVLRMQNGGAFESDVLDVLTNAGAQVGARASAASTTLRMATTGWIDTRGK